MIEKSNLLQRTIVAVAAVALVGLSAPEAWALSLGRISVQSALGEPLKAEVDVPNISAEEAATLNANVASPAAFSAAGLEYNPAMSSLQATLSRRADGRAYLRITTAQAINDPFIDMILEVNWSSGRIVRDFTMLFDPPALKKATAPTLPQSTSKAPASVAAKVITAPAPVAAPQAPVMATAPAAPTPAQSSPEAEAGDRITVKRGDYTSKIALRIKSDDVSLDQMMVALLRANPDAFSNGNVNRLRAGAVLDVPGAEQAKAISAAEATQLVIAQSKDFDEFRRNLAGNAPKAAVEAADRKASGTVEAKVEDNKSDNAAADKLTLSKGAVQAKSDEEARLAKERADADAKERAAELAKNIEDLKKLSSASASPPAAAPAPAQPADAPITPAVTVATPKPEQPQAAAAASDPPKPAAKAPPSTMVPPAEVSLVDQLLEDPTLPLAGGGLIALLGGLAVYRRFQAKKKSAEGESTFSESSLQPDSYFGNSGGQQVDTGQPEAAGGASVGFSNSEMASPDDVDPVAEADVYLAYGRDRQAEEILKAAVPTNPGRLAIHTKLLEIYAKRRDAANFLATANTAFKLTDANGPEWARICELGLSIDPGNPLYQPGGASDSAFESSADQLAQATQAIEASAEASGGTDLDLDLDFSADEAPAANSIEMDLGSAPEPAPELPAVAQEPDLSAGLDFDIAPPADAAATAQEPAAAMPEISLDLGDMQLDLPDAPAPPTAEVPSLELPSLDPVVPAAEEPVPEAAAKSSDGMLEFDLGSLSLDLDAGGPDASAETGDSALETKLALAEEFVSIGDNDGARALIEEVVAEAKGALRERAQSALSNLS